VPFYPSEPAQPTFADLLRSFAQGDGSDPGDLLSPDDFDRVCDQFGVHFATAPDDVWTPLLTVWTFLWQVLSPAKSCVAAVGRALAWRLALGLPACSANTGAYCKARQKLSEALLRQLACDSADRLEDQVPPARRFHDHRVHLLDGTLVSAADTAANQAEYPRRAACKGGVGFALVRCVALLSLATGACRGAVFGRYQGKRSGETSLARQLLDRLGRGDLVVADRLFGTWWLLADLQARAAAGVFRLHAHRRKGGASQSSRLERTLGEGDQIVVWQRPARPAWMDKDTYRELPRELRVRLCWRRLEVPGFRTSELVMATTLLDAHEYPVEELVELYRQRWHAELDLRNLKTTLKMEHLVCKTPDMLRQELWAHLLGYNLIRAVQAQAARHTGRLPRAVSFAGTLQTLCGLRELLTWMEEGPSRLEALAVLWTAIGAQRVGDRPNRVEPRRLKRGPKPYRRLRQPRRQAQQELLAGTARE
jgi:hypothetical protein